SQMQAVLQDALLAENRNGPVLKPALAVGDRWRGRDTVGGQLSGPLPYPSMGIVGDSGEAFVFAPFIDPVAQPLVRLGGSARVLLQLSQGSQELPINLLVESVTQHPVD